MEAFVGKFLFYLIFAPACAATLNRIMYMSNYKMQATESMRRIDEILLAKGQKQPVKPQKAKRNDICFEKVTFTYPTGESPAVCYISFQAKTGTTTALVGHSGSGKTTIAGLIPRFYDIQEGCIRIGGVDVTEMEKQGEYARMWEDYRKAISWRIKSTGKEGLTINVGVTLLMAIALTALIFLTQWIQYKKTYTVAYRESANRRIVLAEKLRRLPLSFFGQRDLSDLTTTMMGDCSRLERVFSNAIPGFFGNVVMFLVMSVGMLVIDWRMGLCI